MACVATPTAGPFSELTKTLSMPDAAETAAAAPLARVDNKSYCSVDAMMAASFTGEPEGGFTLFQTAVTAFKSVVGPAVLYNPYIFYHGGYIFGTVALLSAYVLWAGGVYGLMLINIQYGCGCSYEDLAVKALGRFGKVGVSIAIVLQQLGIVMSYFIFAVTSIQAIEINGKRLDPDVVNWSVILIMAVLEIPVCVLQSLERLRPTIMIGTAICSVALAWMIGAIFVHLAQDGISSEIKALTPFDQWTQGVGSCVFAFEGSAALALPVHNSVRADSKEAGAKVYIATVAGIVVMYVGYGLVAYIVFGPDTQSVIFNNLGDSIDIQIVRWCFIIMVMMTFPFQMFPASSILAQTFLGERDRNLTVARLFRALIVVFLAVLAYFLGADALSHVTALVGSLLGIPLSFMFPAAIHWQLAEQTILSRARHLFLLIFGGFMMVGTGIITVTTWNDKGGEP